MDINTIAGWIGCITGVLSVIYQLFIMYKDRTRLIVDFPEKTNIFFKRPPIHKTLTNLQGLFYIKITNPTSKSITVSDIDIYLGDKKLPVIPYDYDDRILKLPSDNSLHYDSVDMQYELNFPLRLESFDCKSGIVFLRFISDTDEAFIKLKIITKTPTKCYKKHLVLKRYVSPDTFN